MKDDESKDESPEIHCLLGKLRCMKYGSIIIESENRLNRELTLLQLQCRMTYHQSIFARL